MDNSLATLEKIDLPDFLDQYNPKPDKEVQEIANSRSIFYQLIDLYGEAKRINQCMDKESMIKQLESCHRVCVKILNHSDVTPGMSYEVKVAEWSLYDFYLWDNKLHNNQNSIMSWFNQWYIGFNFSILKQE